MDLQSKGDIDMTVGTLLKQLIKKERTTQTRLAETLGYSAQSGVASALASPGISVVSTVRLVEELGYDVIIAKKRPGRKMTDAYYLNEIIDYGRES